MYHADIYKNNKCVDISGYLTHLLFKIEITALPDWLILSQIRDGSMFQDGQIGVPDLNQDIP